MKYEREPYDVLYKLSYLKEHLKEDVDVAIFKDQASYDIIINGNGQVSYGDISKECFKLLRKDRYLSENTLDYYKRRRYYAYLGPINIGCSGWKYVPNTKGESK